MVPTSPATNSYWTGREQACAEPAQIWTSQSWVERGQGLRGPKGMASVDNGRLQSDLVMQTQGSLRLILSTKLWAQTQIDKASENVVHITATNTEDQA
ncbi:Ran-Binding Protein 3 [Manis pentadactyla]|nr:Ran-Binding Protein 3 [Manis pentadactyla]